MYSMCIDIEIQFSFRFGYLRELSEGTRVMCFLLLLFNWLLHELRIALTIQLECIYFCEKWSKKTSDMLICIKLAHIHLVWLLLIFRSHRKFPENTRIVIFFLLFLIEWFSFIIISLTLSTLMRLMKKYYYDLIYVKIVYVNSN